MTLSLFSQATGNVDLGSEITNGVMTNGCVSSCIPTFCSSTGTGNHSTETVVLTITGIPAGNSAEITFTSNLCGGSSGLDGGDDIFINGTQVFDGSGNAEANVTECVEGGADILIEFTVNRRDETINVSWDSGPTDPTGALCFMTALPVDLSKFDGQVNKNKIELNWSTETEINNDRFIVQHSVDSRQFSNIGIIEGYGTSSSIHNYDFLHERPSQGNNYYRLKQIDFDGTTSFSDVINVDFVQTSRFDIYPSITDHQLTVETLSRGRLNIFSMAGQLMYSQMIESDIQIDVSTLQAGLYIAEMEGERLKFVVK